MARSKHKARRARPASFAPPSVVASGGLSSEPSTLVSTTLTGRSAREALSHQDKYTEACTVVRHYSNFVIGVRTLTIVQGVAILGAAAFLSKEKQHVYALASASFGLLLTFVLFTFH